MDKDLIWFKQRGFKNNKKANPRDDFEWDALFMRIAREVSKMSKCASRQIGAVLVKDRNVISIGFNGSPMGSNLCQNSKAECPRKQLNIPSGQNLEVCPAQHAETNAITLAARHGVSTKDTTMYCWCCQPCKGCAGAIINAGVTRVVYLLTDTYYDELAAELFKTADIELVEFDETCL